MDERKLNLGKQNEVNKTKPDISRNLIWRKTKLKLRDRETKCVDRGIQIETRLRRTKMKWPQIKYALCGDAKWCPALDNRSVVNTDRLAQV